MYRPQSAGDGYGHARARLNVVNMCLSLPVYESEGVNQRKKICVKFNVSVPQTKPIAKSCMWLKRTTNRQTLFRLPHIQLLQVTLTRL